MTRQLNQQNYCGWCSSEVSYFSKWASVCKGCGYKNHINPNPCSNILVVKDNQVLMVKRAINPGMGKFDLPGGYAEVTDVSMEEATIREFEEEIGLSRSDITELTYLGSKKSPAYEWMDAQIQNLSFYYVCKLRDNSKEPQLDTSENSAFVWVGKEDVSDIDYAWDIDRLMLEEYFKETV